MKDNLFYTFILEVVSLLFIVFIFILFRLNISCFYKISLIYKNNNIFQVIVNDKELSLIKKNNSIYINDKNYFYRIDSINRRVYKDNYHEVFIKTNSKTKYRSLDVIEGELFDKKISLIDMLKKSFSL